MTSFGRKLGAFAALAIVQISVALVYKFSQTNGNYSYSTASAIALAEIIKFCMSVYLTYFNAVSTNESSVNLSWKDKVYDKLIACRVMYKQQLSKPFLAYTFVLALLYCINNQLAFFLYKYVDIASVSIFKSLTSLQTAVILWTLFQRPINRIQWSSIVLQVMGLIIVQYDACKKMPLLAAKLYIILIISCTITSTCTVWNEHLVKNYAVNLHIQNSTLYLFGIVLNLSFFFYCYKYVQSCSKGFFEGYTFLTVVVVFCNSILGLVITVVYKYADAIIKTFSTACGTGVLLFLNWSLFGLPINLTTILGAGVIFLSSYVYFSATSKVVAPNVNVTSNKSETIDTVVPLVSEQNAELKAEPIKNTTFTLTITRIVIILLIILFILISLFTPSRQILIVTSKSNRSISLGTPSTTYVNNNLFNQTISVNGPII